MAAGHRLASVSSKSRPEYQTAMPPRLLAAPAGIVSAELAAGGASVWLLGTLMEQRLAAPPVFALAALLVYLPVAVLVGCHLPTGARLGAANRVTLARAVLVSLMAASLVDARWLSSEAYALVGVATLALLADGLDGWVARRTGTQSDFGARFDMELDAFLILVLACCVVATGKAGAWVLAIAAMRYVFVAAMWPWPWLAAPLPESWRRKAVCVWQVAALVLALSPWVAAQKASIVLVSALVLLAWSFALDVWWLHQRAQRRSA